MHCTARLTLSFSIAFALVAAVARADLPVPKIGDLVRADRNTHPTRDDRTTSTFILKTTPHDTLGDAYVIITDLTDPASLASLDKLAKFHNGSVLHVNDLGVLRSSSADRQQLIADLKNAKPRYVAIAPSIEHFTTDMLLGTWSALTSLGDDHRLAVFPALLAAPDAKSLDALVERSINAHPQSPAQLRPFVIGQVLDATPYGQRSLQKVRMMRNLFADYGCTTHSLIVFAHGTASGMTVDPAPDQWQVSVRSAPVPAIPTPVRPSFDDATLLLMFGHGNPGTACSLSINAFRDVNMKSKIVMCGDCYSAAPTKLASTTNPATPIDDDNFALRAVGNGALIVYAHMHENQGFPHLFAVLENWTQGATVGEGYQRLINALLDRAISPEALLTGNENETNSLLYVIIGDPALQPLEKLTPTTAQTSPPAKG